MHMMQSQYRALHYSASRGKNTSSRKVKLCVVTDKGIARYRGIRTELIVC